MRRSPGVVRNPIEVERRLLDVARGALEFLGDGHGGFQDAVVTPISQVAAGIAIADFDGDSHPDVAVTTGFEPSGASVLVLPGHGDGTFGTEHDYALGRPARRAIR